MAWEERHATELARFVHANPLPAPLPNGAPTEQQEAKAVELRAWTKKCTKHFKFKFPAEGWCSKRASSTRPYATDVICTYPPLFGYDIILSGGALNQSIIYHPRTPGALPDQVPVGVDNADGWGPQDMVGDGVVVPVPEHRMRLGASLFWGLGGERHGWPELDQQLAEYKAAGVDFVRTLIHLRTRGDDESNPWFHIGLHAEDGDLETLIGRYCDRVARFGMKVEWTLMGGMGNMDRSEQQDRFVDRVVNALRSHLHQVEFIEVMNEYGINGGSIPVLHRMALRLRAGLGDNFILALSSPDTVHGGGSTAEIHDEVRAMALHEANAMTPHHRRDTNEVPDLGPFAPNSLISNEPIGPSTSVRETDKPADFERDWKAAAAAGYYAYVLHSDSGVWSTRITNQYKDGTRGKWPIFSSHTNGPAILATMKRLRGGGTVTPPPPTGAEWMEPGQQLKPGHRIYSLSKRAWLEYQVDGNVCHRVEGHPTWCSNKPHPPWIMEMQPHGNLVAYDTAHVARWWTPTPPAPGSRLRVTDKGIELHGVIWATPEVVPVDPVDPVDPIDPPPPPPPPPPPSTQQRVFGSNLGSPDMLRLFTEPDAWQETRKLLTAIRFASEHIMAGTPGADTPKWIRAAGIGPNTYAALVSVDAFRKVRAWGLKTLLGVGVIKPDSCDGVYGTGLARNLINRIQDAGGHVDILGMDEPLSGGKAYCRLDSKAAAAITAKFCLTMKAEFPHLKIGLYEAYPSNTAQQIVEFVGHMWEAGFYPDFLSIDVDRNALKPHHNWQRDFPAIANTMHAVNKPYGQFLWGQMYRDAAGYRNSVLSWADRLATLDPHPDILHIESWEVLNNKREIPLNLPESDPLSHCAIVREVVQRLAVTT